MEWMSLELKLISCRDLKAFNFFQKISVYAVVSVFNDEIKTEQQRQQTHVDREGGGNPEWNHAMQFDLKTVSLANDPGNHLFVRFKLRCEGVVFGKRTIGEVRVPFNDLIDEFNGTVRFVSYQVRTSDAKPNGVLNFSYKVNGKPKKNGIDSPRVGSPSGIHFKPEKVKYPSLEVEDIASQKSCIYPSLDDIHYSSSPAASVPSPKHYYPIQAFYGMPMPPPSPPPITSPLPAPAVGHGSYYYPYPYPSPLVQTPGPNWYTTETTGYGCTYTQRVNPGVWASR